MTTRVNLRAGYEVKKYYYIWNSWMMKTLFVPGEPKPWAWILSEGQVHFEAILFLNEEDAIAFKLRFGL
jgi:hypothetical protein